ARERPDQSHPARTDERPAGCSAGSRRGVPRARDPHHRERRRRMKPLGAERYRSTVYVGTTLDPSRGPSIWEMRWLSGYEDVTEALRSPLFEQGGGVCRDSAPFVG